MSVETSAEGGIRSRAFRGALGRQKVENVFFFALVIALGWVPFWFGSNTALGWGINAVVFCGLVILYELSLLLGGRLHRVAIARIWPAAAAVLVTVIWCVFQVATFLPVDVQHPIWQLTRETLSLNVSGSISVNRDLTLIALVRLLTAASAFWLALQLSRNPRRARLLVQSIAVIGLIYAIYGLVAFFAFPKTILWFEKEYYVGSLTSTFINRNSYATYAAFGLVCSVTILLGAIRGDGGESGAARRVAVFFAAIAGNAGAWLAASFIVAMAMMLTASRGGISSAVLGLLAGLGLASLPRKDGRSRGWVWIAGLLTIVALMAVALSFGDLLAVRFGQSGFASDDRLATYALTLMSIADRPLLGFGYGTFAEVFPMYRDASISPFGIWDKAHNTYLELLQGLGLPVGILLLVGIGWLVWRCGVGVLTRRQSLTAPLAASAVSVVVLTHALADFSLQIQAVALTWVALLGAGVAQSWSQTVETGA